MNYTLKTCFILLLIAVNYRGIAQNDSVVQRIFLVGNAGVLVNDQQPAGKWLKKYFDWDDSANVLVYLGNNVLPEGVPGSGSGNYNDAIRILDEQISVVKGKNSRMFFVP